MNKTTAQKTIVQLCEELGNNVKSVWYHELHKIWWVEFYKGEMQEFESFEDLFDWIKTEGQD